MKGFVPRNESERVLRPILICIDCHGAGERWHALWPELKPPSPDDPPMIVGGTVEKKFGTCETCGGDGRLRVQTRGA